MDNRSPPTNTKAFSIPRSAVKSIIKNWTVFGAGLKSKEETDQRDYQEVYGDLKQS